VIGTEHFGTGGAWQPLPPAEQAEDFVLIAHQEPGADVVGMFVVGLGPDEAG